jgi:hypothetical protein
MKKISTKTSDAEVKELSRAQLGRGVRGKYFEKYSQGSNVVVIRPEIIKVFPTSQAVNDALARFLAFAQEANGLTHPASARAKVRR